MNLNQSNVSLANPEFGKMLEHLQSNILKFHGRNFAYHLFFRIRKDKVAEAKAWISKFSAKITTAKKQLQDDEERSKPGNEKFDGGTVYTLSLSAKGYKSLGLTGKQPDDAAFKQGLQTRADMLKDTPARWEKQFQEDIDMLIIVADSKADTANQAQFTVWTQVNAFADQVIAQRGNVLKMAGTGIGIEHFGYADGVSQPMYVASEITAQNKKPHDKWDDTTNLDRLLVPDKGGDGPDCFGSYLVFRKLEQNVKAFKEAEGDNRTSNTALPDHAKLPRVKDSTGKDNIELPGAMIVGRFESGCPVTKSGIDIAPGSGKEVDNNFNYADDAQGLKCPLHAHIRLVNPRAGNPDPAEVRTHRITRRGIPFDDHGSDKDGKSNKRFEDGEILNITEEMLEKQPEDRVGLLFMCYQSDINGAFEELQAQWANTGIIDPSTKTVGEDSIITQGADKPRTLPSEWNKAPQSKPFQFSGFVKMKGGEYFYTPSIPFLQKLS